MCFRKNNIDIVRLIASLQVFVLHLINHMGLDNNSFLVKILNFIPGVPVFFFVSGFLISKSFENNPDLKEYFRNRILRIYPALIFCTFLSIIIIHFSGYYESKDLKIINFIFWVLSQISFLQFYNPDFMRGFGIGTLNGNLWTISVEIQFYILVPVIYYLFDLKKLYNKKLIVLISFFIIIFLLKNSIVYKENLIFKLFEVSFAPWFWMFCIGIIFQKNFNVLHKYLSNKAFFFIPFYIIISYYSNKYLGFNGGNKITPFLFILLAFTIFSFAYSFPKLNNILKGNDISYGIYIYQMPIINIFIYYGYIKNLINIFNIFIIVLILAGLSWFLIEKKFIFLKKNTIKDGLKI